MKIKYVHFSEPEKEKIHDTEIAYQKRNFISLKTGLIDMEKLRQTQEEFDIQQVEFMERDKKKGYILSYEVVDGGDF